MRKMQQNIQVKAPWRAVMITSLFFFFWFVQLALNNTLIGYYTDKYQIENYGFFTSMYLLGNMIMFIPAGILLDRFSAKRVVAVALSTMILAIGLMAASSNLFLAYASMLIIGFSGAFTMLSCVRVSSNCFTQAEIGFPISMCITVAFLGSYLGNIGGRFILDLTNSGQAVQIANFVLGAGILAVIILFLPSQKEFVHKNSSGSLKSCLVELINVAKNSQNWLAAMYISLMNAPVMILEFCFGQAYLTETFSILEGDAAGIAGIISIGYMIGGPVWNKIADYSGRRKLFMVIGAGALLAVISLLFVQDLNNAGVSVAALSMIFFLIGAFSAAQNIGYPVITASNPIQSAASATSLSAIIIMGGGAVAQAGFGMVKNQAGFQSAYLLLPVGIFVAVILALLIRREDKQKAY